MGVYSKNIQKFNLIILKILGYYKKSAYICDLIVKFITH